MLSSNSCLLPNMCLCSQGHHSLQEADQGHRLGHADSGCSGHVGLWLRLLARWTLGGGHGLPLHVSLNFVFKNWHLAVVMSGSIYKTVHFLLLFTEDSSLLPSSCSCSWLSFFKYYIRKQSWKPFSRLSFIPFFCVLVVLAPCCSKPFDQVNIKLTQWLFTALDRNTFAVFVCLSQSKGYFHLISNTSCGLMA